MTRKTDKGERPSPSTPTLTNPKDRNRKRRLRERANLRPQANTAEVRKELRDYVYSVKEGKPCADCGGVFHPVSMDFDHVEEGKIASVSAMIGYGSRDMIIEEVKKCDVVCSNCHRLREYRRSLVNEGGHDV